MHVNARPGVFPCLQRKFHTAGALQAQGTMRPESDEFKRGLIGQAVDKHKIGLDMTIAAVHPAPA